MSPTSCFLPCLCMTPLCVVSATSMILSEQRSWNFSSDSGTLQFFLVIPVPSSCFSDTTLWVSYAAGLGELVFLWLLVNLSRKSAARPDRPVGIAVSVFCLGGSATALVSAGPGQILGRTGQLQSRRLAWVPVPISPSSLANLVLGIFSLDLEYSEDKPGGIWLSPTRRLGTGRFLYPCVWPSVSTPLLLQ